MKTFYRKSRRVQPLLEYISTHPRVSLAKACRKYKVKVARNPMKCLIQTSQKHAEPDCASSPPQISFNNALPHDTPFLIQPNGIKNAEDNEPKQSSQSVRSSPTSLLQNYTELGQLYSEPLALLAKSLSILQNINSEEGDLSRLKYALQSILFRIQENLSTNQLYHDLKILVEYFEASERMMEAESILLKYQ